MMSCYRGRRLLSISACFLETILEKRLGWDIEVAQLTLQHDCWLLNIKRIRYFGIFDITVLSKQLSLVYT